MRSLAVAAAALALVCLGCPAGAGSRAEAREPDPRWVFYSLDETRYTSPWWSGARRTMIGYGCTRAPYYSPDPRCPAGRGFHHGIDVALPCGSPIRAGRGGRVVAPVGYGPAYGSSPLVVRNRRLGIDILLAHARRTYVEVGQRVRPGMLLARSSDSGAPDGCHLHLEVRTAGGGLAQARRPVPVLDRVALDGDAR